MRRPVCALLLFAAASCAEITSEREFCTKAESDRRDPTCGRPLELAFITSAVLAPSCGQTQCHSTFRQAGGFAFDTPDAARRSLLTGNTSTGEPLLAFDDRRHDPTRIIEDNKVPHILRWVTEDFPVADLLEPGAEPTSRMPFDAPLPEADVELLTVWIQEEISPGDRLGREPRPGGSARGAQCNPALYGGYACNYDSALGRWVRVECGDDFNFGAVDQSCANTCQIVDNQTAVCL